MNKACHIGIYINCFAWTSQELSWFASISTANLSSARYNIQEYLYFIECALANPLGFIYPENLPLGWCVFYACANYLFFISYFAVLSSDYPNLISA